MKFRLAAGAEVDLLTEHELRKALKDHRDELAKMLRHRPIVRTPSNSVTLDAAGAGVIDLGTPGTGRTWSVRRVSACYQDLAAALAAGIAAIVRGNDPTNPLGFVERIPNGTQLPASDKFSDGQLDLQQDEHLFVRITGGTALANVFGSAQVLDGPRGTIYDLDTDEDRPKLSSVI